MPAPGEVVRPVTVSVDGMCMRKNRRDHRQRKRSRLTLDCRRLAVQLLTCSELPATRAGSLIRGIRAIRGPTPLWFPVAPNLAGCPQSTQTWKRVMGHPGRRLVAVLCSVRNIKAAHARRLTL